MNFQLKFVKDERLAEIDYHRQIATFNFQGLSLSRLVLFPFNITIFTNPIAQLFDNGSQHS